MKKGIITYLVLGIIVISIILIILSLRGNENPSQELVKCIGENSKLYVQLGCGACEVQEEMFGENYKHLETIDCALERQECLDQGITGTPTWIINKEKHKGIQTIDELKELTRC